MISRILIVIFIVSLTLLPGKNADATLVTEHIQFQIQSILGIQYTTDTEGRLVEQVINDSDLPDIWMVDDIFNISLKYNKESKTINKYWGNNLWYPVPKNHFAADAAYEIEIKREAFGLHGIDNSQLGQNFSYILQENPRQRLLNVVKENNNGSQKDLFMIQHHLSDPIPNYTANIWFTDRKTKNQNWYIVAQSPSPVPEPSTMVLLGSGLVGLIIYRKKRKHN